MTSEPAHARERTPRFFYGPVIVGAALAMQAIGWGVHNGFGVFFTPITNEFGWSRAMVSGAASLSYWVYGLLSILMGNLSDRFGPRLVMGASGLLYAGGLLLMSTVREAWQMYLFYSLIVGIGISSLDVVLLSTAARWYARRRGAVSGIIKTGTGIGMVLMPLVISWLILSQGWRRTFLVLGIGVGIAFVLLAQLMLRDPRVIGQQPDGEAGPGPEQFGRLEAEPTPDEAGPGPEQFRRLEAGLTVAGATATGMFWIMCGTSFLTLLCTYTLLLHIVPHAMDLGLSGNQAAGVLSTLGGASIAGRLVMGAGADRMGYRKALTVCFGILAVGLCMLQWAEKLWELYLFALVHGFAHGGFFALFPPAVAWLFGTRSHGSLFGFVIFSGAVAGAIGPLAAGAVFDATGTYRPVFMALIAASLAALFLSRTLKPKTTAVPPVG